MATQRTNVTTTLKIKVENGMNATGATKYEFSLANASAIAGDSYNSSEGMFLRSEEHTSELQSRI